jgi:ribosomal protection tetracycline resistance protein
MADKKINIGILAHVDAGKTTLTEGFLYLSGETKILGNVDKGNTQSDFLSIEKERGISVRAASSSFHWKEHQINLIDTPGHIDFSAEVERTLSVLDAAILVISAVEGVQAHTENIWLALKEHQIPTLIFINKVDRLGADVQRVLDEIKSDLAVEIVELQKATDVGQGEQVKIQSVWNAQSINESIIEAIANANDTVLEKYLEGQPLPFVELNSALKQAVLEQALVPVLMGVAKNLLGLEELLNRLVDFMSNTKGDANKDFSALVFRMDHDKKLGKLFGIRIFDGQLSNRMIIRNKTRNLDEKVSLIKKYQAGKLIDCKEASAGDIVAVSGLSETQIGDVLGSGHLVPKRVKLNSPLFNVQVKEVEEKDFSSLVEALYTLNSEDPRLQFEYLREEKELNLRIMGWIQMEVLEKILESRFQLKVKFENPLVIYKETPLKSAEGFARYWMPKPCWAIIKLKIEPGEEGSGVIYESLVGVNKVKQKYQNEVARTLSKALKQGPKGWEVTDLKITFMDGEDHEVHTRPGDFSIATPMAVMNALINSGTRFLEPYLWFSIKAPEELLGAITSDIIQMRGSFESPSIENGKFILKGLVPVATSTDFPIKLSSRSGGKAKIKTRFHSYKACADEQGLVRAYKGISPLDEAKYILKARKAIQESWKD